MLFHNISRIENGRIITYDDDPGWIGVDLDGTLAEYHGFKGMEHIGDPIPAIVQYVKELLEMGERVKIFTARVDRHPEAVAYIQQWLQDVGLPILEVTCIKDAGMKLLVDDRARQVKANTGKFVDASKPKRLASGEGFDFWLIGNDVYRAPTGSILDIYGAPQAKRWECTYPHWQRFREVFSWAKEVRDASKPVAFTTFQGLRIGIENPKGSVRKGVDEDGDAWKTKMYYPYGYIENTEGVDGDEVDCFIGPNPTAPFAYVINLKDADHEEKVMLGFATKEHARDAFCAHYDQPEEHLGPIREMKMEDFKRWLKENR